MNGEAGVHIPSTQVEVWGLQKYYREGLIEETSDSDPDAPWVLISDDGKTKTKAPLFRNPFSTTAKFSTQLAKGLWN